MQVFTVLLHLLSTGLSPDGAFRQLDCHMISTDESQTVAVCGGSDGIPHVDCGTSTTPSGNTEVYCCPKSGDGKKIGRCRIGFCVGDASNKSTTCSSGS